MLHYCHICETTVHDVDCNLETGKLTCPKCKLEFVEIVDEPQPQPQPQRHQTQNNYQFSFHVNINGQPQTFSSSTQNPFGTDTNPFPDIFGADANMQNPFGPMFGANMFGGQPQQNPFASFFGQPMHHGNAPRPNPNNRPNPTPNSQPNQPNPQQQQQRHVPPEFRNMNGLLEAVAANLVETLVETIEHDMPGLHEDSQEEDDPRSPTQENDPQGFQFFQFHNMDPSQNPFPEEFEQLFRNIFERRGGQANGPANGPRPGFFFHMGNQSNINFNDYFHGDMDGLLNDLLQRHRGQAGKPPAEKEVIDRLEKVEVTSENIASFPQHCAVCKDAHEEGETVCTLPCGHYYHEGCVVPWLNIHCTCPVCRSEVTSKTEQTQDQTSNTSET